MTSRKFDIPLFRSRRHFFGILLGIIAIGLAGYFLLPAYFTGSEEIFFAQLWLSRVILIVSAIFLAGYFISRRKIIRDFFAEQGTPYRLATVRIAFFGYYTAGFLFFGTSPDKYIFPWVNMPDSAKVDLSFTGYLFQQIPVDADTAGFLKIIWAVALLCAAFGLFTRWAIIIYVLVLIYLMGIPQLFGKINNYHYKIWFPAILAMSRCGTVWSLDAWIRNFRRKRNGLPPAIFTPSNAYLLPIKFIWLLFGIIYFFPGFWKLWDGGLDWIFSNNLRNLIHTKWAEFESWRPFFRIDRYPVLLHLAAAFVVVFELSFLFLLFHPVGRKIALLCGVVFHLSIFIFMKINFLSLALCYLFFFPNWDRWLAFLKKNNVMPGMPAIKPPPLTAIIILGVLLIGINGYCGLMKIFSWPFSCYPTFSLILESEQHVLYYQLENETKPLNKDFFRNYFSPERFKEMETDIIRNHFKNNFSRRDELLGNLITIWQQHFPVEHRKLTIYLVKIPVNPDDNEIILESVFLKSY